MEVGLSLIHIYLTEHIVPTLEEALLAGKGQIMFNLDKAYSVFDEVYACLLYTSYELFPFSQTQLEQNEYLKQNPGYPDIAR